MKKSTKVIKSALLFALCFAPAFSLADSSASGTGCDGERSVSYDLKKHGNNIIMMAGRLYQYLHNNVHRVAIVARAGGDQSKRTFKNPEKQKYSHAGIAWKDSHGFWYFKHVLNTCGQNPENPEFANSEIFDQPLAQFLNDNPHFYDIHIGSPSTDLQDKIVRVLEDESWYRSLYNHFYNIIGHPFKTVSQNSNGWVLAVMAAAQSGHRDLTSVIDHYRREGFVPSQVCTFFSKTASTVKGNISTKEHPKKGILGSGWGPGCYDFVSAASLYNYMGVTPHEICHPEGCNIPLKKLNKKDRPKSSQPQQNYDTGGDR